MTIYSRIELAESTTPLFEKHKGTIGKILEALAKREFYAHYPENDREYSAEAQAKGKADYEAQLNTTFSRLLQSHDATVASQESSPYTREALGISYPAYAKPATYVEQSSLAFQQWKNTSSEVRAGILLEALDAIQERFFEIAHATMHTTGQGYMMSFQASGPHANDRALEAIAMGYHEISRIPTFAQWDKPMGKVTATIRKYYKPIARGVAVTVGCSTFPIWNSVPGIFANLITGNTVIVKPHPLAIYPIAIVVAELQQVLKAHGFDPHTVLLAPDTADKPITKELCEHPQVKIIDYTGGSSFGEYVESMPGKITFTEKAGVNSVIIDSTNDLGSMMQNLAFSVSLYSGQMCTCPQNFFIPKSGIKVGDEMVSYEQVVEAFTQAVKGLAGHPKAGPAVCGAIQNENTFNRLNELASLNGKVLLESFAVINPEYPNARTASPVIIEVSDKSKISEELFGPIVVVVPTENTEESIRLASELAASSGAISCAAYTTDEGVMAKIADTMAEAFTPVAFNLTGNVFVNQNAAFSDFHVSGGNPSGNASFTDTAFVAKRFVLVEAKVNAN